MAPEARGAVFEEVSAAKARFEHLSPYQLLRRDLKCVVREEISALLAKTRGVEALISISCLAYYA